MPACRADDRATSIDGVQAVMRGIALHDLSLEFDLVCGLEMKPAL